MRKTRLLDFLFFATVFSVTFEQVHWRVGWTVELSDVLATLFLVAFAADWRARGRSRAPRTTAIVLAFFGAFLLVYLIGFFNLETRQAFDQFGKGLVKFLIHFLFLACGIALLARRTERFYWRTLGWFVAGIAANAAYGVLQLGAALAGHNLDAVVLSPLTGGASQINLYGVVNGRNVYRPSALTPDANHLAVFLIMPLLVLTPIYLRLEPRNRWRLPLAFLIAFLLGVELATLSRSGVLGLAVGLLVLAIPYRRRLTSTAALIPLALVAIPVAWVVESRRSFFTAVLRSRLERSGRTESAHFGVYDFIPQVLHSHPFFGLGLNNFSVYYAFVTGKTNWGPHSFYVALVVESGIVGTALFAIFLWYLFRRLRLARRIGRALAVDGDPLAARVRPLAWGLTAALAGTMAANVFYLTMSFYYFYVFAILVLAVPIVFGRRISAQRPFG